jgi:hypothetical protein
MHALRTSHILVLPVHKYVEMRNKEEHNFMDMAALPSGTSGV